MGRCELPTLNQPASISALLSLVLGTAAAGDVLEVPAVYPSIQAAVDAAQPGDDVLVAPGVYEELIDYLGKGITIRSLGGASVTTLDGGGVGTVVLFVTAEGPDSILDGFTVTGGHGNTSGPNGGGAYVADQCSPIIRNCRFISNHAPAGAGAGIAIYGNPQIVDCDFTSNVAYRGGGVFVGYGFPTLDGCSFANNSASDRGGAIATEGSGVTLLGSTVKNNSAPGGEGGGIYSRFDGWLQVGDAVFCHNPGGHITGEWVDLGGNCMVASCNDCDADGVLDECTAFDDCNANFIPDTCDLVENDCNANEVPDDCDIASGTSVDDNRNLIPDECEPCLLLDINGDYIVDTADLLILLASWGPCAPNCFGDINQDGAVGTADLLLVLASWGPCPTT